MSRKPKEPPHNEGERCFQIRKRSKRGEAIAKDELAFCVKILRKYPAWYAELDKRVFNATVPFGSFAKYE